MVQIPLEQILGQIDESSMNWGRKGGQTHNTTFTTPVH
jgi:hypothetical protein